MPRDNLPPMELATHTADLRRPKALARFEMPPPPNGHTPRNTSKHIQRMPSTRTKIYNEVLHSVACSCPNTGDHLSCTSARV